MLEVRQIGKSFKTPVLRDVSLNVPKGSVYALIGPGASGKSVLLKTIAGLLTPDSGDVRLEDASVTHAGPVELAALRRRMGMLFQNYALFDFLTVGENIAFPLRRLFDLKESEIKARVAERLARVALPGFEDRMTGGLSGGQKKRVGVARATVAKPDLLLYDEPTAGLDPVTSKKIYNLIEEEQRANGTTVVVISSDVAGVLGVATHVAMLLDGAIIFDGTVKEAKESAEPRVRQFVHGLTEGPL